jgi:hypothetical protein
MVALEKEMDWPHENEHDRGKGMPYQWGSDTDGEPHWKGMSGGQNCRTAVVTKMKMIWSFCYYEFYSIWTIMCMIQHLFRVRNARNDLSCKVANSSKEPRLKPVISSTQVLLLPPTASYENIHTHIWRNRKTDKTLQCYLIN